MKELQQHTFVRGIFRPRRRETLKRAAWDHIGREVEWAVAWLIEEGAYAGQWALSAMDVLDPPMGWVPEEDVELMSAEEG